MPQMLNAIRGYTSCMVVSTASGRSLEENLMHSLGFKMVKEGLPVSH